MRVSSNKYGTIPWKFDGRDDPGPLFLRLVLWDALDIGLGGVHSNAPTAIACHLLSKVDAIEIYLYIKV